jgi:DNA-binding CsgD family transcriptional regulator
MKNHHMTLEDWEALERLNHLIYDTPVLKLLQVLINELKSLVSYSHSLTHFVRYEDGKMESFQYESPNIPKEHLRLYVEKFITMDYINWYARGTGSCVFRESDVVPDSLRLNSNFMSGWMKPLGLFHGVGMIIARNDVRYAGIYLYRGEEEEDFSDRDLEILGVLQERLCRKFFQAFPNGLVDENLDALSGNVVRIDGRLTNREREILAYINAGVLRNDLSDQLCITENTLNKHFANIYKKLNIGTYEQLIQMLKAR